MSLTPLEASALALLTERPMHPYEMFQTMVHRFEDRLVKVRPGSLYHAVARLDGRGLVRKAGVDREGNRPERTTYEITEAGAGALEERVAAILAVPEDEYPAFPFAVSLAHELPLERALDALRSRVEARRADLAVLRTAQDTVTERAVPKRYWLDITLQTELLETEISWTGKLIDDLASGRLEWAPDAE